MGTTNFTAIQTSEGITIDTGGLTVTAGGITVAAGGITATGDYTVTGDLDFAAEAAREIKLLDSSSTDTVGGALSITGAGGAGTGAGGAITVTSGTSANGTTGTAAASGAVTITSGTAGTATTGTGGAAGAIAITGAAGGAASGAGGTGGAGSTVTITAGAGGADGEGASGTGGAGGDIDLVPGAGGAGNTAGADGLLKVNGVAGFNTATCIYETTAVSNHFFIADRAYRVTGIRGRPRVAGSDGGAVTATIEKCPSGTAIGSGTDLHTGTYDLKGTADTDQDLTLSGTVATLKLAAGDALSMVITGTTTAAVGAVTVTMVPI